MIDKNYLTETVAYQGCGTCGHTLLEGDRFCRRCGTNQSLLVNSPTRGLQPELIAEFDHQNPKSSAIYETSSLPQNSVEQNTYHPVSGSLVNALVAGMTATPSSQLCSPLIRKAIFALSMIPIWLIIIFLSPLDAYLAAQSAATRAECQPQKAGHRIGTFFRQA